MPAPSVGPLTDGSRAAVLERVVHALGLSEDAILASPHALPLTAFATFTHLNARGRATFTDQLAAALAPRLEAPARSP
jgi:hypothetical protein